MTAGGLRYQSLTDIDLAAARQFLDEHLLLPLHVDSPRDRHVRPGGTLVFVGGTGARGSGPDRAPSLETNELARILLTAGQVTGPVSFTGAMPWRGGRP